MRPGMMSSATSPVLAVRISVKETVASTLTWAIYELAKSPKAMAKAKQEARQSRLTSPKNSDIETTTC